MLEHEARAAVTAFMDDNEDLYHDLLENLRAAAETVKKKEGQEFVFSVYSRASKQGGSEFKSRMKLASKLMEKTGENPDFSMADIVDIVGLTVVVYYNDQIQRFIDLLLPEASRQLLQAENFGEGDNATITKVHRDHGYHATHLKFASKNPKLAGLRVELQVKTMLHDAWGAKMHELTYKPRGKLDPDLRVLMESMGDGLQAIERQSELLRDTIAKQWIPVQRLRTIARTKSIEGLLGHRQGSKEATGAIAAVMERIKAQASSLASCSPTNEILVEVTESIGALKDVDVDALVRLRLAVYVASLRSDTELTRLVDQAVATWLATEPEPLAAALETAFAYRQTNRLEQAIERLRSGLDAAPGAPSSTALYLELAECLIEVCFYADDTEQTKREVGLILSYIEPRIGMDGMPDQARFDFVSAASDIVLGTPSELDDGLAQAQIAKDALPDNFRSYCDVFIGYGWQRRLSIS